MTHNNLPPAIRRGSYRDPALEFPDFPVAEMIWRALREYRSRRTLSEDPARPETRMSGPETGRSAPAQDLPVPKWGSVLPLLSSWSSSDGRQALPHHDPGEQR